jgi:hypothetical protein
VTNPTRISTNQIPAQDQRVVDEVGDVLADV